MTVKEAVMDRANSNWVSYSKPLSMLHVVEYLDKARCCWIYCGSHTQTWHSRHSLPHASDNHTIPPASCHPSGPGGMLHSAYASLHFDPFQYLQMKSFCWPFIVNFGFFCPVWKHISSCCSCAVLVKWLTIIVSSVCEVCQILSYCRKSILFFLDRMQKLSRNTSVMWFIVTSFCCQLHIWCWAHVYGYRCTHLQWTACAGDITE